jgi:glycosyltransferase involved in cell wall biosynthesis
MNRRRAEGPVVLIGPLPPPYGGVSVHVRRLATTLVESSLRVFVFCQEDGDPVPGVGVVVLERFTWRGWLRSEGPGLKARVVHCHEGWEWSPALLLALIGGARVVVTVHSETTMDGLAEFPWLYRFAAGLLLRSRRARWIAVSAPIRSGLLRRGARADRVALAPAYLPIEASGEAPVALPAGLAAFAAAHHRLLTVYGWRVNTTSDGADLYGFDLAIEAVSRLLAAGTDCGLVILIPSGEPSERMSALRRVIQERGLGGNVCLWTRALADPTPLWSATDVYLRPTRSDGDAVSVREVLALGGTVVASDCCDRPVGTRLFASGDAGALAAAVLQAVSAPAAAPGADAGAGDTLRVIAESYGLPADSFAGMG